MWKHLHNHGFLKLLINDLQENMPILKSKRLLFKDKFGHFNKSIYQDKKVLLKYYHKSRTFHRPRVQLLATTKPLPDIHFRLFHQCIRTLTQRTTPQEINYTPLSGKDNLHHNHPEGTMRQDRVCDSAVIQLPEANPKSVLQCLTKIRGLLDTLNISEAQVSAEYFVAQVLGHKTVSEYQYVY